MDGISKLLSTDGYIQVNKYLIKQLGLHEAIMIGELCAEYNYWDKNHKLTENDMFYSSRDNLEENTGLNEHYQRKALSTLKTAGIVSITKKGLPAVNYYKIHFDKLLTLLSTSASRDEELDIDSVNLNNNKQTNITEKEVLSKDNTTNFQFGKKPAVRQSLFTKCLSMIDDYTTDSKLRKALIDYLKVRLEIRDKPLYVNSWKGLLNKLDRDFDASERLAVVYQSIERGYASFFPVNRGNNYGISSESGAKHVPSMTEEDYIEEEKRLAELEAKGVQVRF